MQTVFRSLAEIMESVVVTPEGCWEIRGCPPRDGYVNIRFKGTWGNAHRIVYEAVRGPVPPRILVCHKCNNKRCIRPGPRHCYAGSAQRNCLDMVETIRAHRQANHWRANSIRIQVIKMLKKKGSSYGTATTKS